MYMFNSPEFFMVWFATLCIGAAPAFINYNLEGKALSHCLEVCETKLIIVEDEENCKRRVDGNRAEFDRKGTKIVVLDAKLKSEISSRTAIVPGDDYRAGVKPEFPYTLIYTSYVSV